MKHKTWANRVLQTRGWIIGSAAVLLLLSAGGLTLLAQHAREQSDVVTVLLALHLAAWSYVLGIVGLVLLPVLELIGWLRMPVKPESKSQYSPVEPGRRDLANPEREGPQFLQQGVASVASVVPSRLSRQSHDRNKATSSTKVA
jgi:hypothetical protein